MNTRGPKPLLILQEDPQQRWTLHHASATIGRAADNDIVLDDREVSRRHARLWLERGRWHLEDEGSRNGTLHNEQPIQHTVILEDGDEIGICDLFHLVFVDAEVTVTASTSIAPLRQPPKAPRPAPPSPPTERDSPQSLRIDAKTRQVWVQEQVLQPPLSASQYALLELLLEHSGAVVSRDEIAQTIWPQASGIVSEQAIDSLLWRLRKRINQLDASHEYIVTIRGHGVQLVQPPPAP